MESSAKSFAKNGAGRKALPYSLSPRFYQGASPSGAYYNPANKSLALALINVGYDNETCITFREWDDNNNIKPLAKQLFKFYLPNNYMQLYNMIVAWENGSDAYTGKTYTIDGRSVRFYFYDNAGKLIIYIGNK